MCFGYEWLDSGSAFSLLLLVTIAYRGSVPFVLYTQDYDAKDGFRCVIADLRGAIGYYAIVEKLDARGFVNFTGLEVDDSSYCCIRRLNLSANLDMGNRVCTTQDSENIADVPPSVRCAFLPREPIVQTTA